MADLFTPSRDEIMGDYLRDIRSGIPGANTATNSEAWVRASAIADIALPIYANAIILSKEVFPPTASETSLKRFGNTYGVSRLGAINASGTGTASASVPLVIADGSQLVNPSTGVQYETIGATIIPAGSLSATAYVVALDPGVGGDADPGTILNFVAPPPGLDPVFTVQSVAGGDSAWSLARWGKEILRRMRQAPRAGNIAHFIELGLAIPGLEQVFVYPSLRGRGTMDIVLTVAAASGSRIVGTALIARYFGALLGGARAQGGGYIPGIPSDILANTGVHAAVAQETDLLINFRASAANPFASWPPYGSTTVIASDETTWYKIAATPTTLNSFTIALPASGTPVTPTAGSVIGVFFPSIGFCKATILSVTGTGPWAIVVGGWVGSDGSTIPTDLPADMVGAVVTPWSSQLAFIAGVPLLGSLALSGAIPNFFANLGPGEMTALTAADTTRRRRWPRTTDTDPLTGLVEWPTDVTARLTAAIVDATDAADLTATPRTGVASTPAVPHSAHIGTPPSILTLGTIVVIPF